MTDERDTPGTDPLDGRILAAWRDLTPEDHRREAPPAGAWEGIARELGTDGDVDADDDAVGAGARVTPLPARRRRPPMTWLAGVAALLLVGVVASVVLASRGADGTVQSRAELSSEGLAVETRSRGTARLVVEGNRVRLDVELADLPDLEDDEVLEVWLIDPDSGGLQSVGLTDGETTLLVPSAVDTERFSVVDVSIEPTDGDPAHSAESVVRGALETV
ncbi:anti-sigma factor [Iamia sp. SCSIO 61187]|uniref:anti-sigma factor n=1 Tax=Iamia sp. SCSIO 61187 TaxID=2722752 RepID=UPI001C625128|nr:anti-sigma factor [Iamia sp. SCSIO 61187]QYG93545.1 anti-sigma factor [Iamia sp. SCSIO 61187]